MAQQTEAKKSTSNKGGEITIILRIDSIPMILEIINYGEAALLSASTEAVKELRNAIALGLWHRT